MIATEILKPVFALVDEKVTLQKDREKVIRSIMDVLYAAKGLVSIDINDVRELFQEGGIIHTFDVSVDALKANRMNQMVDDIIRNATYFEPYNRSGVFLLSRKAASTDGGTKTV